MDYGPGIQLPAATGAAALAALLMPPGKYIFMSGRENKLECDNLEKQIRNLLKRFSCYYCGAVDCSLSKICYAQSKNFSNILADPS